MLQQDMPIAELVLERMLVADRGRADRVIRQTYGFRARLRRERATGSNRIFDGPDSSRPTAAATS